MPESSTIRQDNPLFIRYGALVERCFAAETGTPVVLFPVVVKGSKEREQSKKHLQDYADPDELAMVQKLVDKWRSILADEAAGQGDGADIQATARPVTQQFRDFRDGLQSGKEVMLDENPFYEITFLFYRINLSALKRAFSAVQAAASDNPPKSIKVSRSYRHIWMSDSSVTSLRQKWLESIAKMGSLGKLLIGMILFAGSTMTTAKGVIDLVQLPSFVALLGGGMAGAENETVRTVFAVFIGLILSSVILDFKSRLFQGTAEVGQVFRGFVQAFRRYPRWVFASLFLTMISIWTNYDGIVLLISKTEDLAFQWQKIESQVNGALGDGGQPNVGNPASLHDLRAALIQKSEEAIRQFKQVPEDERSGAASSGIAKIGPRYWAKYFIVHGGYIPKERDIASSYRRTAFINRIDGMLVRSGLDLTRSLEEKIKQILALYDDRFRQSEAAVRASMGALSSQMTFTDYSLDELLAMFQLESYHVNAKVQGIVALLEQNKAAFSWAAQEINQLAASHIALLRVVDKVGKPSNNQYTIDVRIGMPQVEAIDRLRQDKISMAERRSLVALKALMLERYGVAAGSVALFFILFIAVFMDLSDPILYSAMIARWGRRDRHFLDENVARFRIWEDDYVQHLRKFLVQPEVLTLLPKMPSPKIQNFHHLYNYFLEDVEPRVKDLCNRGWFERLRFWFLGLFLETRIAYVEAYNARQTALMRCLKNASVYAPRLLNRVFPGVLEPFRIGVDRFDSLFDGVYREMKRDSEQFEQGLLLYAPALLRGGKGEPADRIEGVMDAMPLKEGAAVSTVVRGGVGRLAGGWAVVQRGFFLLFCKPLIDAEPDFPLTRLSRLRELALSNFKSRGQINHLAVFVPSFRHFLRERLFVMKETFLQPLTASLAKIPNGAVIEYSLGVGALREEYVRMERGLMELLGLSQFQGIQVSEQMVRTIIEQSGVDELVGIYLRRDTEECALERRIANLEVRLARAHKLIKDLVEGQDTLIFTLTKIRREYLSPINATLSRLQTRSKIEKFLGLGKIKEDLAIIERCLLELWDSQALVMSDEPHASEYLAEYSDMGAVIDLIHRNAEEGKAFDMVAYVKQLEVGIAAARKKLDAAIYQLTMVDRITTNVLELLDQALELATEILDKDMELQAFPIFDEGVDQQKIDFLNDNRLFFRTVSLQVDSLRARINNLGGQAGDLEGFSVELARQQEKQAIMLRYFLKNTLEYLKGKRDGIGLTAALAELQPRLQPSDLPVDQKNPEGEAAEAVSDVAALSEDPSDPSDTALPSETETPSEGPVGADGDESAVEPDTSVEARFVQLEKGVRERCTQAKTILLNMSLLEWDLLKRPIPPRDLLQKIHAQQPALDAVCLEVEGVLNRLEGSGRKRAGEVAGPEFVPTLQVLQDQADTILARLGQIFNQVSAPPFVDRRAPRHALQNSEEQTRLMERVTRAEVASRRGVERMVLQSQVEIMLPDERKIFATTRDLSTRALCLETSVLLDKLRPGMDVTFRLLSDAHHTLFPGKLTRVRSAMLIVTLVAGHEGQFVALIREEVLREREQREGILTLKQPQLPESGA